MKKRKLLLLSFVSIATMILSMTSCKGNDNPNPNPPDDDPIVTPEIELETVSITNKEALKTLVVEYKAKLEVIATPSTVPQEFTFKSSDEEIIKVSASGELTAINPGEATITATCNYKGITKEDTIKVTVTNTFFSHTNGTLMNPDFTHELDEENPYVKYGGGGFMFYRNVFDTRWYAEATMSVDKMLSGEKFGKIGLMSTDIKDKNGMYYYFDAPLGDNNVLINNWKGIGFKDRINNDFNQGEFPYNIVRNFSKEEMGIADKDQPCLRYGDKFKMGLLRDGAYYHFYFNDIRAYSVKSNLLDPNEKTYPCFMANLIEATVSNYSYILNGDEKLEQMIAKANEEIGVKSIAIEGPKQVTINNETENFTFKAKLLPTNAIDQDIIWESTDEKVAKVDANGKITPVGEGVTTIRAKAVYPYGEVKDEVELTVVKKIHLTDIDVATTLTINETESVKLSPKPLPVGASDKFTFKLANDNGVAKVDATGLVTGLKAGEAEIIVSNEDDPDVKKTVKVTVMKSYFDVNMPACVPTNDRPLIDFSKMHDETPVIKVSKNPKGGGFQGGATLKGNVLSTKWLIEVKFDNVDFFNNEVWGKLFLVGISKDQAKGKGFFIDSVVQSWVANGWRDVGHANWKKTTMDGYTVGNNFKPGQGIIPAGWRDIKHVPSGGTTLSPKIGLIRDGKTYSFLVNDKVCFTMNDTSIPETEANSPYVGAFNAAYELKEFLVTDDATIIDQKLGK